MQVDGLQSVPWLTPRAPEGSSSLTTGLLAAPAAARVPLDTVRFDERRAAARFVPCAATSLTQTLATLHKAASVTAMPTVPLPLAAAAPASSPAAAPALRIAADLQTEGFHLLYKRRFYIPLLMNPYTHLSVDDFAKKSQEGCTRLAVSSSVYSPVAVKSLGDLQALDAFYLGGTACAGTSASLVAALGSLYRGGYNFTQGSKNVGAYGAYVAIDQGKKVTASRYGEDKTTLRNANDASRIELFRVGSLTTTALPHADEARTLLSLEEQQKATMWPSETSYTKRTAEQAWTSLFDGGQAESVWAGADGTPLVELTRADLTNPAQATARLTGAMAEYRQMLNQGIPADYGRSAWKALSAQVAGESFTDRVTGLGQIIAACGKDAYQALDGYDFVRKNVLPGEKLSEAVASFAAIRSVLGDSHHSEAQVAYLRMRDHLDEALPGKEPADQKRKLFLELLEAVQTTARVEELWRKLDCGDPRAEQVDVFTALHRLEKGFGTAAEADYAALVSLRAPGEKLSDVLNDFALVRRFGKDFEPSSAIKAFELQRRNIAQNAPGQWTDDQRRAMFKKVLEQTKKCDEAVQTWKTLGQAGPGAELEQRVNGWLSIFCAEDGQAEVASNDLAHVLSLRQPGETVDAAVQAFVEVRARLGPNDSSAAQAAFRFVRTDIDRSLPGPWKTAEKKDMYLKLLGALHDHSHALKTWGRLAGKVPPADFPQRLDAFVTVLGLEHGNESEARKTMDLLLSEQRAGEPLADTLKAFSDVRSRLPQYDEDHGRSAFRFIRRDLAATLPGAWSDDQRAIMYLQVLEDCKTQQFARNVWSDLTGGKKHTYATPEFPKRVEAFHALHGYEGEASSALSALAAIEEVAKAKPREKLEDLVADYLAMRPVTSAGEGTVLFKRIHLKLTDAERAPFLKLQKATGSLYLTDQAWTMIARSKLAVAPAADLVAESLAKTRSMQIAQEDLSAVTNYIRQGETVAQAAAALDAVRQALPLELVAQSASTFGYMRRNVAPAQEQHFMKMLGKAKSGPLATSTWEGVKGAGSDKNLVLRANLVTAQDPQSWPAIVDRMKRLERSIPSGVDHDRAASALLFVAALPDANATSTVLAKLPETHGSDRTSTLEWLCAVMTAAGDVEGFDQAWADVHRAGAPGTIAERQLVMRQLLDATRRSADGFDASLSFLRRLDLSPDFANNALSAIALAGAMQGHAGDSERAFEYILDAREQGAYANETLDATLTRFATLYAASQSVETALTRLDQTKDGSNGGGKVEQKDGDIIIGGIRVPRAKKPEEVTTSGLYDWFVDQLKKRKKIHEKKK